MAAESDAVTVVVNASVTDFEKQLQHMAVTLEKVLNKMEKDGNRAGKAFSKSLSEGGKSAADSMRATQQAAGQLTFQLNDIGQSLAMGASPFMVMAQQGSQVTQILQQIREQGGGIKAMGPAIGNAFLSMLNPINLVANALIFAAGYAISYFSKADDEGDELNKVLKAQSDLLFRVAEAWGAQLPQVAELAVRLKELSENADKTAATKLVLTEQFAPIREEVKLTENALKQFRAEAERKYRGSDALKEFDDAVQNLQTSIKELKTEGSDVRRVMDAMANMPAVSERSGLLGFLNQILVLVQKISREATKARNALVFSLNEEQLKARSRRERAERGLPDLPDEGPTPERRVDPYFADPEPKAAKAGKSEAEREAEKAAEKLDKAIAAQTAIAVEAVTKMIGKNETADRAELNAFMGNKIDAAMTAWCAAFVNAALGKVGVKGTGSNVATDFGNWGKAVDLRNIQPGDVGVQMRGHGVGEEGGHVGLLTGKLDLDAVTGEIKRVELISGNSADTVTKQWVDAYGIIARRATDATELQAGALAHLTEKNADETKKTTDLWAQYAGVAQQAIGGFIQDLRNGVDAGTAFNNMLNKILDSLINMAIQAMFSKEAMQGLAQAFSGIGGAAGGLGAVGGGLDPWAGLRVAGAEKGGVIGSSSLPRQTVDPRVFIGARHYARGGMILPAGAVPMIGHVGEVVIPRKLVRQLTGAGGGAGAGGSNTQVNNSGAINIDMSKTGAVGADDESNRQFGLNLQRLIRVEMVKESRNGGLLRRGV